MWQYLEEKHQTENTKYLVKFDNSLQILVVGTGPQLCQIDNSIK